MSRKLLKITLLNFFIIYFAFTKLKRSANQKRFVEIAEIYFDSG